MNRKDFILNSSLTAIGMSIFGSIIKMPNGAFHGDCETTNDILGPFYRADAPLRSDLTKEGMEGTKMTLTGRVFQSDCITPIKNAMVEIWHCNADGEYDNESDEFNHRGRLMTDDAGFYSFTTILPGKYKNGKQFRPAHIHYRVTAPNSKELISQLYFKGDPHIADDPWASKENARLRILEIIPEEFDGNMSLNFDVYLGAI